MDGHIETHTEARLAHLPVSIFSTVMGLTGLAIAWQKAQIAFGVSSVIWQCIASFASAIFLGLLVVYAIKIVRFPTEVKAEWKHPVRVNFFPTISICLLLLGIVWMQSAPFVALLLWSVGTLVHLAFTFAILSSWMYHTHYAVYHANPAWFIPVVGNLFVPICGVWFAPPELSWFFFSIGLVFWIILMTIIFYRIFFHEPLQARLMPTLFILLAPPAVGFIAYGALVPQMDGFARVMYYTALFLTLLLGSNVVGFIRGGFFLSAWAYSFPVAAMCIASFSMASRSGMILFNWIAAGVLGIVTFIIVVLIVKTLSAVRRHAICVPE